MNSSVGTLYLCATPIGNLGDITLRVLETLKSVDLILAEDTRVTRKLLNHYAIQTPLRSFHAHNEKKREQEILERLQAGENLALVSDAGLPLISDPGAGLVRAIQDAGLPLTCLPGASAPAMALLLSGLAPMPYCFLGFLPRQSKARKVLLANYQGRPETLVCFESPHRLGQSLQDLLAVLGDREAAVCRELSKKFEEIQRASLSELAERYAAHSARGEVTLVVAGASTRPEEAVEPAAEDLQALRRDLEAEGYSRREILKRLQQRYGLSRNQVYRLAYGESDSSA